MKVNQKEIRRHLKIENWSSDGKKFKIQHIGPESPSKGFPESKIFILLIKKIKKSLMPLKIKKIVINFEKKKKI